MMYKEFMSCVAIFITVFAFFPYIRGILRKEINAHVFSWIIWGTTTFVVFLAQLEGNGGTGAWPTGVSGTITILIAILAFIKRGDISITKTDWLFFLTAMSSLPFWYFTSDPLWAVIILTAVDILGFGPTIRKAYFNPHAESLLFFTLFVVRNLISVIALEKYSVTTILFPLATGIACLFLIVIVLFRKLFIVDTTQHQIV